MEPLTLLLIVAACMVALNVLGGIVRYVSQRQRDQQAHTPPQQVGRVAEGAHVPRVRRPLPDEETIRYWWNHVCSRRGILGLLATPVQPCVLVINSYLLAATLEVVFESAGTPLLPVTIGGWERELTLFDLIGGLLSGLQVYTASVVYRSGCARQWLFCVAAGLPFLALLGFEVWASIVRGLLLEGGWRNAGLSGLLAFGIAGADAVLGLSFLDDFLVPLTLLVLRTVTAPVSALARRWESRPVVERSWQAIFVAPAVALDTMLTPLHGLDHAVGHLLARCLRLHTQGDHHATHTHQQLPWDAHAVNGHQSGRVHHPAAQAPSRLDDRA
jgi:hypothetical protein